MSQQYAQPQMAFLVTIDMEGSNTWARRQQVTTRNAEYLPRFQHLCERHGMSPTSLTDWEVARSSAFREPAGDNILRRGAGECDMASISTLEILRRSRP